MPINVFLASGSPQRKRILTMLGLPFRAIPSNVPETTNLKNPSAIAKHLAFKKADAVAAKFPNAWVLGVDTLVVLPNGKISGKPKSKADAKRILKTYSGKWCDVISGMALVNRSLKKKLVQAERARLYFRNFTEKDIDAYLASTSRWKNSSGAMTIEGVDGQWVKRLVGDYWNVVGLPIVTLKKMLALIE